MSDRNSIIEESMRESQTRSINLLPSTSQIKQNMLESQAHPLKPSSHHISLPSKENIRKSEALKAKPAYEIPPSIKQLSRESKDKVVSSVRPNQAFLKYYQQNLQLKQKQEEMQREMRNLREQLSKKNENTRMILEEELKRLAQGKRADWDRKQPLQKNRRGVSGNKNLTSKKVDHLLEIIDHYKAKLITAEEEVTNLKRQKHILEQDIKLKDRKFQSIKEDKQQLSSFEDEINLGDKLKRNIREMEMEREKAKLYEMAVRSLEVKLRASEMKAEEIDVLRAENRSLEEKVIRLTNMPNFNNVVDKAEDERKGKELESKLKLLNEKYNLLKDNSIKTEAELKILQNKLIEATHDINTLQSQNEDLKKQSINNPILLKLNKNPQLLQELLLQVENRKRASTIQPENAKLRIEKLILEKQELAKQVLNYQVKVQTLEDNFRERERLSKIEKPQSLVAINQSKVTSKLGVIYDGDTSVFSEQNTNIPSGSNYFDLYLGEVSLLQTMIQSVAGLSNSSNPHILATVDFYNHNTESSKLAQGCRCDLQSQIFFRVNEDDFFFKYLQKNCFQVDVWASEASKLYHLGKASIELKYLISKARSRVSPVISTSAPLFLNQKVLGSINIVMRMRLPIFDQVEKLLLGANLNTFQQAEQVTLRRLVIQIDQGRGFGDKSNTFVYFPFRLEDHYTKTSKGNSPAWNYIKMMEINYDADFKNYLRKGQLQFIVFDDNVLVMDDKNMDVVGNAVLYLAPLLEGKTVSERLQVKKGNQRKGTIDVKIFWYQVDDNKDLQKLQEQRKMGPQGVHEEIRSFMREHNVDAEKVFRLIDDNKTGVISFDEFQEWLLKVSTRRFTQEVISKYYKSFKEPVNHRNFISRVNQEFDVMAQKEQEGVAAGLEKINEFLKINTTQIKKTSLEEYLVGKNMVDLMKTIPTDRAGYISREKLQQFLDQNGLQASIVGDRIKLSDFLRKHQRMNLTL